MKRFKMAAGRVYCPSIHVKKRPVKFTGCIASQWRRHPAAAECQGAAVTGGGFWSHAPFPDQLSRTEQQQKGRAHSVDSFCRSRPFEVFLTLEMPSRAPDSVTTSSISMSSSSWGSCR